MTPSPTPTAAPAIQRMIVIALGLIAAIPTGWHFFLQLQTIPLTEPMGMWETKYVSIAQHWPAGYQWGNFVPGHDNYAPAYPLFRRPAFISLRTFIRRTGSRISPRFSRPAASSGGSCAPTAAVDTALLLGVCAVAAYLTNPMWSSRGVSGPPTSPSPANGAGR